MSAKKITPIGIKIISVYYYIVSLGMLIVGLLFLFAFDFVSNYIAEYLSSISIDGSIQSLSKGLIISLGIIFLVSFVVSFFIARGLWRQKNWARIVAAILSMLAILSGINALFAKVNIIQNILGLALDIFIAYYLLYNRAVKKAFS